MSYNRGYHGRRHQREDAYREYEDPETRFKNTVIRMGDTDPLDDVEQLVRNVQSSEAPNVSVLSEGLRIGLTEQPFKIPYYALLLRRLCDVPVKAEGSSDAHSSVGRQVLDDLWKGFQAFLDKLAWREVRFCVHFFAHLTVAKIVSPQSMLSLLQSFSAVLDEFGVSQARAKRAARCAAEGLMRAGRLLKEYSPASVIEMITAIQTYSDLVSSAKWLVHPVTSIQDSEFADEHADEMLDCAVLAMKSLDRDDFVEAASVYPQPYVNAGVPDFDLYDLPSVLVPPDAMELDGLMPDSSEDAPIKKEEWPEFYLSLFSDDITPNPQTAAGYAARSDIFDIVDIFEINRKECARLLVEYPKWTPAGTFKQRPGAPADNSDPERVAIPGKDWQLESTVIEAVLGAQFLLPEPFHKPMYYSALITELCKISPQTFGPAVGKSIRKCYTYLADGLDVDVARRFAEWFSVHMSNFNFQWVWKEWVDDLNLCAKHPKRVFIRQAVELEIRLSYFDRIMKTLPPQFQDLQADAVPDQAPGPEFGFDDPSVQHYETAQTVLEQLRARAKPEDVITLLESLRGQLTEDGVEDADSLVRSIAVQSLLHTGSRSFSHFLNAIERYIVLLRSLATSTSGSRNDSKLGVLEAVSMFWARNRQMVTIVFDKLMQYQIVDPTDVVRWVFARASRGLDWDLLKGAIDKANGRVIIARKRISALRKEEDENRARAMANDSTTNMEVDSEVKPEPTAESPALATALKALSVLTREQKATLSLVVEGFVDMLHSPNIESAVHRVVTPAAWDDRTMWAEAEWTAWYGWSWYKHFCRAYAPYLRTFSTTLMVVSMAKIEGADDEAARALKKIWNASTGQE